MAKNRTIFYPQEESITYSSQFKGCPSWLPQQSGEAASSSQGHRQAEKRRRDRINGQLARLRNLVPFSDKMDKAALLERVVDQIKNLRKETTELGKFITIPADTDDITVECHTQGVAIPNRKDNKNVVLIKATFCCEDRPDLIPDLIRALKELNLTTIGADIASVGGRIKSILLLHYNGDGDGDCDGNADNKEGVSNVSAIKQSLFVVLTRLVSFSATTSSFRVTSKRQRFFFSS